MNTGRLRKLTVVLGVKFVEEVAREFDIGAYFESNGHGTVLFSKHALDVLKTTPNSLALVGLAEVHSKRVKMKTTLKTSEDGNYARNE